MRKELIHLALGVAIAGGIFALPAASYGQEQADEVRIDLNFKNAPFVDATKMITERTGINFVFENDEQALPKITLSLKSMLVEDAIRYMCQSAGLVARRDENGVYVIGRPKAIKANDPGTVVPAPKKVTKLHKFKLRSSDAGDVYNQLRGGGPSDEFKAYRELNEFARLSGLKGDGFSNDRPMVYVNNGAAPVPGQSFSEPKTSAESGSSVQLPGEMSPQIGGGQLPGGGFGNGGFGQGNGGNGLGGGGGQGPNGGSLPRGGLIPQGLEFLSFDPSDNSIIVRGTDEEIRELQDAISFFDVAPKQVLIKVEFVTTGTSLNKSFGIDTNFLRAGTFAGTAPGTFARATDPIFFNFATGNVAFHLRARNDEGGGRVVNAPVLRTLNNQFAQVSNNVRTTVFTTSIVGIGNGNVISTVNPQQVNATTFLAVKPRINDDGTITMFLQPSISDFGQIRRGPNGSDFPDQTTQSISLVARVKNGDTIVLAGLTRKQETGSRTRFPILGDLPIVGQFFRTNQREVNNSELLIFVTPTIMEDDENGGLSP